MDVTARKSQDRANVPDRPHQRSVNNRSWNDHRHEDYNHRERRRSRSRSYSNGKSNRYQAKRARDNHDSHRDSRRDTHYDNYHGNRRNDGYNEENLNRREALSVRKREEQVQRLEQTVMVLDINPKATVRSLYMFFAKRAGKVRDIQLQQDSVTKEFKGIVFVEFYTPDSLRNALALSGSEIDGIPIKVQHSQGLKNAAIDKEKREQKLRQTGGATNFEQSHNNPPSNLSSSLNMNDATYTSYQDYNSFKNTGNNHNSYSDHQDNNNNSSNSALRTLNPNGKIWVGNLPPVVSQSDIEVLLAPFGTCPQIDLPKHTGTSTHKGFCFAHFDDARSAMNAVEALNGSMLQGKQLKVSMANSNIPMVTSTLGSNVTSYDSFSNNNGYQQNNNGSLNDNSIPSWLPKETINLFQQIASASPSSHIDDMSTILLGGAYCPQTYRKNTVDGRTSNYLVETMMDIEEEVARHAAVKRVGCIRPTHGREPDGCIWIECATHADALVLKNILHHRKFDDMVLAAKIVDRYLWSEFNVK